MTLGKKKKKGADLTTLHKTLGVISFTVFIGLTIADLLPGYEVRVNMAILLFLTFLTLLGFGTLVGDLLEGVR